MYDRTRITAGWMRRMPNFRLDDFEPYFETLYQVFAP
jgi:hypothetical protein